MSEHSPQLLQRIQQSQTPTNKTNRQKISSVYHLIKKKLADINTSTKIGLTLRITIIELSYACTNKWSGYRDDRIGEKRP
jgi:hypothetical protein